MVDNLSVLEQSPSHHTLTRRDFLNVCKAGLGAFFLNETNILREKIGIENDKVVEIETKDAFYYPVYEVHTAPVIKEQLEQLPKLNLYFYEYMNKSNILMGQSANQIINTDMSHTLQANDPGSTREYVFPRDHLAVFKNNDTEISLEGYALPENSTLESLGGELLETIGGAVGAYAYLAANTKYKAEHSGKPLLSKEAEVAVKSTLGWLLTPISGTMLSLINSYFGSQIETSSIQRITSRVNALTSQLHPENTLVFFRNMMMARKLQSLGSFLAQENFGKPKIGYNVGMGHGGIEDFLKLPPGIVLSLLNACPKEFWQKMVERNGGIEALCSSILLTPDENHSRKTVVLDKDLQKVLESKLTEVE